MNESQRRYWQKLKDDPIKYKELQQKKKLYYIKNRAKILAMASKRYYDRRPFYMGQSGFRWSHVTKVNPTPMLSRGYRKYRSRHKNARTQGI